LGIVNATGAHVRQRKKRLAPTNTPGFGRCPRQLQRHARQVRPICPDVVSQRELRNRLQGRPGHLHGIL